MDGLKTAGIYPGRRTPLLPLLIFIFCNLIDAKLSVRTSKSLNTIKQVLGPKSNSQTNEIENFAKSNEGSRAYEEITGVIDTVGESLPGITSGDTFQIVSGALNIISAATSFIPVVGPIVSTVFSLLSMVFGSIGGAGGGGQKDVDIGAIVSKEIREALNKYDDAQLKAEAHGPARVYSLSQAYLKNQVGNTLEEHEVAALSANIPVYSGVKFLGILQSKILENAVDTDKEQIKRAKEYTNLYVVLATLRSSVLWELYSVVRAANHSSWTANAILNVAKSEENRDKNFIKFVVNPDYSRAVFHSMFHPSKWPIITKLLTIHGLQIKKINPNGRFSFKPQKWLHWVMIMEDNEYGTMRGNPRNKAGQESLFYLDPKSSEDNIFYIRSAKWQNWYVYMRDTEIGNCRGWEGNPGPQGEWKFVRYPDGKYLLSPTKWENWFMYMGDNDKGIVRGWEGNPGVQGHWQITYLHVEGNII